MQGAAAGAKALRCNKPGVLKALVWLTKVWGMKRAAGHEAIYTSGGSEGSQIQTPEGHFKYLGFHQRTRETLRL